MTSADAFRIGVVLGFALGALFVYVLTDYRKRNP